MKKKEPRLGDYQLWGADEIRIYTMRGWCIVEKKLYEEVINSFPPSPPSLSLGDGSECTIPPLGMVLKGMTSPSGRSGS